MMKLVNILVTTFTLVTVSSAFLATVQRAPAFAGARTSTNAAIITSNTASHLALFAANDDYNYEYDYDDYDYEYEESNSLQNIISGLHESSLEHLNLSDELWATSVT
jgi:hypothetical protein